ncbi:MAG: membrane protein insertion efficiency factor YidD [Synergistaceae bacterium]|nr:membrane protein insertion efficiency factor YidD [Synergistaceae bacterium]
MLSRLAIILIRIYQIFISPFIGAHCRFYPTCSNYALSVYKEWGFFRGTWLTLKRLIKCGAWNPGGVDLPPKKIYTR